MKLRKTAISLSFLTVAAVAVSTLAAVSLSVAIFASVYSNAINENAAVNAEQTVNQAAVAVNNTVNSMRLKLKSTADILRLGESGTQIKNSVSALLNAENEILSVTVYSEDGGVVFSESSGDKLRRSSAKDLSFNKDLFDEYPDFSLSKPHVRTSFEGGYPWVVTAALKSDDNILSSGRYIAIDFSFDSLAEYIDNVGVGNHGYCYIADLNGEIIYHPQQQVIFSGIKNEDAKSVAMLSAGSDIKNNKITAVCRTFDKRWKIVGISYTDELETEKRNQIFLSITAAFFCCAAVIVVALAVYRKVLNRPVHSLIKAIGEFEKNTSGFSYTEQTPSVKEIKKLADSFVHMSGKINELMDRVRKEETELRKTELRALQAQINPHFLYNTLDSIQWMCEQGKTEDAGAMVGALAKLFRISISRGREIIPIKDELRHAESYLVIQSYRYKNQFSYRFDVDEALLDFLCNKITIQPLIENAIYHGIDRMVDEGEITVTLKQAPDSQNDILIIVKDNGVGMTSEQCEAILKKDRSDSGGIGVKNVNDRLKIYFGDNYGISIKSELDIGTEITVRIPKITKEPEI